MVFRAGALLVAFFALTLPVSAQTPTTMDVASRSAAVAKAAESLRTRYIYPEIAERAAKKLESALAAGDYDQLIDPLVFAERLTADLTPIAKDKHLRVMGPRQPSSGGAPAPASFRSEAGIVRADRLAGNIGYIEVVSFPSAEGLKPALDRALAPLAGVRAMIVDIRRNGGGSPGGVAYLVSQFVAERTHVMDVIWRKPGTEEFITDESWTSPTPTSFAGKPVYVLTSAKTFSGGEEFAYDMQTLKLGVLVGEVTGGGANPGGTTPIGNGLVIFVPNGRANSPITKTNWESVGVKPDVETPSQDALRVALQRLGQQTAETEMGVLSVANVFEPRKTPTPGTDTTVRSLVDGFVKGEPRYDLMTPDNASFLRGEATVLYDILKPLGAFQSVTFTGVNSSGMDGYDIKFSDGVVAWFVSFTADGKMAGMLKFRVTTPPKASASR